MHHADVIQMYLNKQAFRGLFVTHYIYQLHTRVVTHPQSQSSSLRQTKTFTCNRRSRMLRCRLSHGHAILKLFKGQTRIRHPSRISQSRLRMQEGSFAQGYGTTLMGYFTTGMTHSAKTRGQLNGLRPTEAVMCLRVNLHAQHRKASLGLLGQSQS